MRANYVIVSDNDTINLNDRQRMNQFVDDKAVEGEESRSESEA